MTKYEKWKDLRQQTKQARKERDEKYNLLMTCEWNCQDKSCIKIFQVQSLGVPTEENSNVNFSMRYCNSFSSVTTCTDMTCPYREKNADYVLANLKFKTIRADRRRAFWNMFMRSK